MKTTNSNLTLWFILFLFALPFFIAYLLFLNIDKISFRTTQQGVLLTTPLIIDNIEPIDHINLADHIDHAAHIKTTATVTAPIKRQWNIIYLEPSTCTGTCQQRKHELTQLYKALGREKKRVTLANVAATTIRLRVRNDNLHNFDSLDNFDKLDNIDNLNNLANQALTADNVIIVDPQGLMIMYYPAEFKTMGILKDIRTLLKNSR